MSSLINYSDLSLNSNFSETYDVKKINMYVSFGKKIELFLLLALSFFTKIFKDWNISWFVYAISQGNIVLHSYYVFGKS